MIKIQKKLTLINRTIAKNRKIEYIVIHYVGAVSSAKNNVDYFYDKDRQSSAHYFVDEKSIWQCVEDTNIAWHLSKIKKLQLTLKLFRFGWAGRIRTAEMPESKSGALPLGYSPISNYVFGVKDGTRTHDLQGHNLAL